MRNFYKNMIYALNAEAWLGAALAKQMKRMSKTEWLEGKAAIYDTLAHEYRSNPAGCLKKLLKKLPFVTYSSVTHSRRSRAETTDDTESSVLV